MLIEFVAEFFFPLHPPKAHNGQHRLYLIDEKLHYLPQSMHVLIGFQVF
jgi:hypothetical protein